MFQYFGYQNTKMGKNNFIFFKEIIILLFHAIMNLDFFFFKNMVVTIFILNLHSEI